MNEPLCWIIYIPQQHIRHCIICKIHSDSGERCNVPETTGRWFLYQTFALHHHNSKHLLDQCWCVLSRPECLVLCVHQGKGMPDVNSRLMVRKLWDTLHVPVFALVDADPHGTNTHTFINHAYIMLLIQEWGILGCQLPKTILEESYF